MMCLFPPPKPKRKSKSRPIIVRVPTYDMSPSSTPIPPYVQHHHSHRRSTRTTFHTDPHVTVEQIYPFQPHIFPPPPPPPVAPTDAELRKRRKEAREADAAERREIIADMREDTYRDISYVQTLHEKLRGPSFYFGNESRQVKEEVSKRCVDNSEAILKLQIEQKRLYDDHKTLEGNQKDLVDGYKKLEDGHISTETRLGKVRGDLDMVGELLEKQTREKMLKAARKEGIKAGREEVTKGKEKSEPVVIVKPDPDSTWSEKEREKLDEVWKGMKDLKRQDRIKMEEETRSRRQEHFSRKTAMEDQHASDFRYVQELDQLQRERAKASQSWYPHSQPYPSTTAPDGLDRDRDHDRERDRQVEKRLERERETRAAQYLREQERREDRRREDRSRERRDRKEYRDLMDRDRNVAYGMIGAGLAASISHHAYGGGAPAMISGWQQQQYQQPVQAPVLMPVYGQALGGGNMINGGMTGWEPPSMRRLSSRLTYMEDTLGVNTSNLGKVRDGVDGLLNLERERRRETGFYPGYSGGGN